MFIGDFFLKEFLKDKISEKNEKNCLPKSSKRRRQEVQAKAPAQPEVAPGQEPHKQSSNPREDQIYLRKSEGNRALIRLHAQKSQKI